MRSFNSLGGVVSALLLSFMVMATAVAADDTGTQFTNLATSEQQSIESYTQGSHWTVAMLWASDCHICNTEAKDYAAFHRNNGDTGVKVLGVSMDGVQGRDAALDFVQRHDLPFPNLLAEPGALRMYYGMQAGEDLLGTPAYMVFSPGGQLVAAQLGMVKSDGVMRFIEGQRAKAGAR